MAEKKSTERKSRKKSTTQGKGQKTSTKKTTRRPATYRKKKSVTPIIIGLLSVIIILMTVQFFIIPNIQKENNQRVASRQETTPQQTPKNNTQQPVTTHDRRNSTKSSIKKSSTNTQTTETKSEKKSESQQKDSKKTSQSQHRTLAKDATKTTQEQAQQGKPKKNDEQKLTLPKTKDEAPRFPTTPAHDTDSGLPLLPKKGTLVFVFDDAGYSLSDLQAFLDLPFPCCIAVLPRLAQSLEAAKRIRATKKELMLHQPMQAFDKNIDPGAGAVREGMDSTEIKAIVRKNLDLLAPLAGMNNHEGSLITANKKAMRAVLEVAREKNIFFLDSRTSAQTVVPQVAAELQMPIWERGIFIDNDHSRAAMKKEILKGIKIAEKHGYVIMIGHIFTTELADLLQDMYLDFIAEGFSLSTITQLQKKE